MTGGRSRLAAAVVACWVVAVAVLAGWATAISESGEEMMLAAAGGGWLAWAVAPLVGVGGNEVASASRLAPYPVSDRAQFLATWLSSSWDVPALLIGPLLLGCSVALGGPAGLVVAALFVAAATACGQAGAWLAAWALAGRGWAAAAGLGGGLAVAVCAVTLTGWAGDVARVLPSGWAWNAARAANSGRWAALAGWSTLLCAAAVAATAAAGHLHRRASHAEREAAAEAPVRVQRAKPLPDAAGAAAAVAVWRSVLRAPTTKVVLVSTQVAPLLGRTATTGGVGTATAGTLLGVVALACAATLGVNVFAYAAGGATMLLSAPVARRTVAAAHAAVLFAVSWAALAGALLVGAAAGVAPLSPLEAAVSVTSFAALVAGTSLWWSAKHPHAADHDSMRSRPAPGRSAIGFLARAAVVFSLAGWFASSAPWVLVACAALVLAGGVLAAGARLERDAETVAVGVGR